MAQDVQSIAPRLLRINHGLPRIETSHLRADSSVHSLPRGSVEGFCLCVQRLPLWGRAIDGDETGQLESLPCRLDGISPSTNVAVAGFRTCRGFLRHNLATLVPEESRFGETTGILLLGAPEDRSPSKTAPGNLADPLDLLHCFHRFRRRPFLCLHRLGSLHCFHRFHWKGYCDAALGVGGVTK